MKRELVPACVLVVFLSRVLSAQAPPRPSPEHERLHYFVGDWIGESQTSQSPTGSHGKMTSKDHGEMLPGGFFLIIHSEGQGPRGEMKALTVIGYSAEEKIYTFKSFDNYGTDETFKGTIQGDTWTWISKSNGGGKTTWSRFTLKEISPTSYTYKFDVSPDSLAWSNILEGKATKVK